MPGVLQHLTRIYTQESEVTSSPKAVRNTKSAISWNEVAIIVFLLI